MRTVRVNASREYDIIIGNLLKIAGELISRVVRPCKTLIVTDDTVNALYGRELTMSLESAGFEPSVFAFIPGEDSKTLQTYSRIMSELAERRFSKSDVIVALGGGIPGDIAGFAAATYARGVKHIQIPTTLLAAVDSSVGGKTAVNLDGFKNMVGAIWQPSLVICDTQIISDLPLCLKAEGAGEVIKYAILGDADLFERMLTSPYSDIEDTIARCVSMKRDFVEKDEHDAGIRRALNLGHTAAHAIEVCSNHTIAHGIAVGYGLLMMSKVAAKRSLAPANLPDKVLDALNAASIHGGGDSGIHCEQGFTPEELAEAAQMDKKRSGGEIDIIMPRGIGEYSIMRTPTKELINIFREAAL